MAGMNRRAFLALAGSGSLSGCAGLVKETNSETTETTETTKGTTVTTQQTTATPDTLVETTTPEPTTIAQPPSEVTIGHLKVQFWSWVEAESLRYFDSGTEQLKRLRPQNDLWVSVILSVQNLGGDGQTTPDPNNLTLTIQEDAFSPLSEYPISISKFRFRNATKPFFRFPEFDSPREIEPGESLTEQHIFDIPKPTNPVLNWDSVEGEQELIAARSSMQPD